MQARRETLGDRHPDTLTSIVWMGSLLQTMGKLEEAKLLYEEVLQGRKETLGDNHPHTLGAMSLLNSLLKQQGKRASLKTSQQ